MESLGAAQLSNGHVLSPLSEMPINVEKTGQDRWTDDNRRTRDYFSANLARFGGDVRAVDWGNIESQRLRFKVLAEVGKLNNTSLLDVGCGMGDLYGWLKEENIATQYRGIDITPEMTTVAKKRFPGGDFSVENMLESTQISGQRYDFIIASGIFYLRQNAPVEYLQTMVATMFKAARIAVAFNSLSTWFEPKDAGEFYADPLQTVQFCRTLTPWVCLRHDYHPRDFTVFLYRDRRSL